MDPVQRGGPWTWGPGFVISQNGSYFIKIFFQTTQTPKIIFENNTWPHLAKAVFGKAVQRTKKQLFIFPRIQSAYVQTELR